MKKIIITVYSFDELSDEAKQKAIETERHNELRLDYKWWDGVFDNFREQFKEIGIDNADFAFSLSYTQGDYAKLTKGEIDMEKIIPKLSFRLEEYIKYYTSACIINGDATFDFDDYKEHPCIYDYYDYYEKVVEQLEKWLNDKIEELNGELYMALQEEYEYLQSDEVIAEEFKDNETLFYEDGTLYQY